MNVEILTHTKNILLLSKLSGAVGRMRDFTSYISIFTVKKLKFFLKQN